MVYKINTGVIIDNDRNGYFNIGNLKSYSKSELASITGESIGQVVCCTDCNVDYAPVSRKLVHWNGNSWVGADVEYLLTGNTYSSEYGYASGSSSNPSDSMFHDGNAATGVVVEDSPFFSPFISYFTMTFASPARISRIEYGPWSASLRGTSFDMSDRRYSILGIEYIRPEPFSQDFTALPLLPQVSRRKSNTETVDYYTEDPSLVLTKLRFRNANGNSSSFRSGVMAIANLKVYGTYV